ncbi:hypothetical protein [uncultured Pseudoteredinibacter sp.]|uniref:hypothetical protein n=1 Tax=uncultured Pseudoteredinibacter sp. TaxID=1641701 RepID=UPI002634183E|nr:hypothetical protein [uncultured Pseudoteredinibacter sp.]
MQLLIACHDEELLEHKSELDEQLETWVKDNEHFSTVLDERSCALLVQVKKAEQLKLPLNFLYKMAKQYKLEFAICQLDEESSEWEEVCYFGNEEGRPDIFEVACYVGL